MSTPRGTQAGLHHPALEHFLNIKDNRKGNPERKITLEGLFEISTARKFGAPLTELFYAPELASTPETRRLVATCLAEGLPCYEVSSKVFLRLSDRDSPDGVAALVRLPLRSWPPQADPKRMAILDGLEIPGNAGTILRSADGAGLDAVVFINRKVRLTHPKIMHASLGACFSVPIYDVEFTELRDFLSRKQYRVFLADAKGHDVNQPTPTSDGPFCLVIGGEKKSFDTRWYEIPHEAVKIPMRGALDSLNAACAATVLFYGLTR